MESNETVLSDEQIKELNTLDELFRACKIDDITVSFDRKTLIAKDEENVWKDAEVYQFILDEVLSLDIYGNLMDGNYVDENIFAAIKEYAKNYGIEPQSVKTSTRIRRQLELKKENPNAIILYKQHEAYEVIGEDAKTVASELQTSIDTTTYPLKTQQFVPETWFEAERLEDATNKLIENGHQVIIADDVTALSALEYFDIPFPQKYMQLQQQYPDTILFIKVGDFYEVLGENAKEVAKELDLVLTSRTTNPASERIPMVGVPAHAVDTYISRLVARGYKVAIAESQEVNRVVAPGKETVIQRDENLKDEKTSLSSRLVQFAKDYDFYDYQNNLEIGETDEDTEAKMQENLQEKSFCESLISFFTDRIAEISIDNHEAGNEDSERLNTLQTLLDDLTTHTNALSQQETPAEQDHTDLIGEEVTIDGMHFVIESVSNDYVSMRDLTFAENNGFPIFRREHIESILPLLQKEEKPPEEIIPAPQKVRSRVNEFDLHPEVPPEQRHNFDFSEIELETVGKKERFRRNVAAINIIKECEFDNRFATPEEQEILAQYVGWGGLPEAFDENNSAWADEYKELIVTLSPEEYEAAKESTLTAFYTPQSVIAAIYSSLQSMGFKQGNILEPSCGIGNFIGMLPKEMQDSKMYGVEIDNISAQIAQQLYQKSSVLASPFEKTVLPDSFFDVVVGNVPFGDFKVADKRYDKNNLKYYRAYRSGSGKTLKSIQITLAARLEKFNLDSLASMTSYDELNLQKLGEEKTALFAVIPDNDTSFNFLISILYTQLFQQLFYAADSIYKGALPMPVHFCMDEFANISLPDDFDKILSVMRSRGVSVSIIIQNMAQLKALFEKQWESIVGNCDEFLYLGGNEQSTHKYVSELLGKETIDTNTYGKSLGRNGNYSTNYQISGRELMTPDEVRMLDNKYCILFIRGERPILDLKYNIRRHPNFALTEDGGAEPYIHGKVDTNIATISITGIRESNESNEYVEGTTDYEILTEEELEHKYNI